MKTPAAALDYALNVSPVICPHPETHIVTNAVASPTRGGFRGPTVPGCEESRLTPSVTRAPTTSREGAAAFMAPGHDSESTVDEYAIETVSSGAGEASVPGFRNGARVSSSRHRI
jgi:hypothetical protein